MKDYLSISVPLPNKKQEIVRHLDADYLVCAIRRKLIKVQPEELLRQRLLRFLINELRYPENNIDVEVPMSYFKKNSRGRADIVIYREDVSRAGQVLMVIECKAEEIGINDYRFDNQLNSYCNIIDAEYSVLTNGLDFKIVERKTQNSLRSFPTFYDCIGSETLEYDEPLEIFWNNHSTKEIYSTSAHDELRELGLVSEETLNKKLPPIARLIDLFYNERQVFQNMTGYGLELVKDYGLRYTNYGYAFGDGLRGDYRYLMFRLPDGNHTVVSFSIYPQPKWGTYLMIAVDERQGHSVELRLDVYLDQTQDSLWTITHNGAITVGKKGRLKNKVVLDYVQQKCPDLLVEGEIRLGSFGIDEDLILSKNTPEMILKLAKYAVLREEIRKQHS